jgi:hypothetical protein
MTYLKHAQYLPYYPYQPSPPSTPPLTAQDLLHDLIAGGLLSAGAIGALSFFQRRALQGIPYVKGPEIERLARRAALIEKLYSPALLLVLLPPAFDIAYRMLSRKNTNQPAQGGFMI